MSNTQSFDSTKKAAISFKNMKIKIYESSIETAKAAADFIAARISAHPNLILGLATGRTMEPVYQFLREHYQKKSLSFRSVTTFNLDEYVGLIPSHLNSYRATMNRLLFDHIDIDLSHTNLPNGLAADLEAEVNRYEEVIAKSGGIDLQVLGVGKNGHIAFNEPGTTLSSRTHVTTLHPITVETNAKLFPEGEPVPSRAITVGISTILDAKEIMVIVTGEEKRCVIAEVLHGTITREWPISALHSHPDATIVVDRAAISGLIGEQKEIFIPLCPLPSS